jgi:TonB family protein
MNSAHWDLVYGRPPISRDAVLFVVALALHLPLFLMQFKAVVKPNGQAPSFVEIKTRDEAIERILRRGMALPPPLPPVIAKPLNLGNLIRTRPEPPVLPPPVVRINAGINRVSPLVSVPKQVSSVPAIPIGDPTVIKSDKGTFRMAPNTIQSIDVGVEKSITVGKATKINIPTGAVAQAEQGIQSPSLLTSKILVAALPAGDPVTPKSEIKVDKHAGAKISVEEKPKNWEEEELPVIQAVPRSLTPEERKKELFPIHGVLKDRGVDRQEIPEYPEWARKKGIESSVKFRFSVTADGRVKENIEIVKGSGYTELDELARTALLRWVFTRLPPEKGNLVQDGIIEFRFSIK